MKVNKKKVAIFSTAIGATALTTFYPAATISLATIAAFTTPGIVMSGALANFENENKEQTKIEENTKEKTKSLTLKR